MRSLLALLAAHVLAHVVDAKEASTEQKALPTFDLNLDLPPRERWKHIARHFRSAWLNHIDLAEVIPDKKRTLEKISELRNLLDFGEEIHEELRGIVEAMNHSKVSYEMLLAGQMIYELGSSQGFHCSGVLAAKADGYVVQGRNLDTEAELMWSRDVAFEVVFMRRGKPIVRAVTGMGLVGLHTGMRLDHGWAVAQNTRSLTLEGSTARSATRDEWLSSMLKAAAAGGRTSALGVRDLLLTHSSFEDAVAASSQWPWMAPQYFIFSGAGTYEGAVVTLDATVSRDVPAKVDLQLLSSAAGRWVLVQTNDDHWKPPWDLRRMVALRATINQRRKNGISEAGVMQTMRLEPLCNERTLWTWVVEPHLESHSLEYGDCNGR